MLIQSYKIEPGEEEKFAKTLEKRKKVTNNQINSEVFAIMEDVREHGFEAVRRYSMMPPPFDNAEPYELTTKQIDELAAQCPRELYAIMEEAAANIIDYQSRLKRESQIWQTMTGTLGQLYRPLERVGVYVPGGTAAYPSSLLMSVLPARVAGVSEIVVCTPPSRNLNSAVIAAAKIAGVDKIYALGGVQSIAAMAYGCDFVTKVDKIVGPGNAYVTAAKRYAFGDCDIDMLAGPSDILVIADDDVNPAYAAADMLSQAEHDKFATSILVTDSQEFADKVSRELELQLVTLPRKDIASSSIQNYGALCICADLSSAVDLANEIAPEHLELLLPEVIYGDLFPRIRNAGAIFLGSHSPEPLGDYFAGPSHILPTSGSAKFFSPLSFESFTKRTSIISATQEGLSAVAPQIAVFARAEGLEAHARAVEIRYDVRYNS